MDATRLIDPGFWFAPEPMALGDPEVSAWSRGCAALEGHVMFQTSGSSGMPKWIALLKQGLLLSAATVNRHLGVTAESCWGLCLPLHHVGGFGVVARAYEAAAGLAEFRGKWDAGRFTEWLGREGVTHVSLVPTQVHDLVAGEWLAPSSLRAIVVGGGRLEETTGRAARALGWPVLASYGMTETGSQIATQGLELLDSPYQCAPLPLLDIWMARADEEGRLWVSGPALFSGSVARMGGGLEWRPRIGEWHASGDRVEVSGRHLTPLGRMDSVVKILGELVDPESIERELAAAGLEPEGFAVVAVPDERAGRALVLALLESVPEEAALRALAAYHQEVPGFKRIARVMRMEALPLTELGKLRRAELVRLLSV